MSVLLAGCSEELLCMVARLCLARGVFYDRFADRVSARCGSFSGRYDGYECIGSYLNNCVLSVREWQMEKREKI